MHVLYGISERHESELLTMASGTYELRKRLERQGVGDFAKCPDIHTYLDNFYLKRIALRILMGHYLVLHNDPRPHFVGIVCPRMHVKKVVEVAAYDARWLCKKKHGKAPQVRDAQLLTSFPQRAYQKF